MQKRGKPVTKLPTVNYIRTPGLSTHGISLLLSPVRNELLWKSHALHSSWTLVLGGWGRGMSEVVQWKGQSWVYSGPDPSGMAAPPLYQEEPSFCSQHEELIIITTMLLLLQDVWPASQEAGARQQWHITKHFSGIVREKQRLHTWRFGFLEMTGNEANFVQITCRLGS